MADPTVAAAVRRDLKELAKRDPVLAKSALAAAALALAKAIDGTKSAHAKSACANTLIETLNALLEQAPPQQENDELDAIRSRRAAEIASRGAVAAD